MDSNLMQRGFVSGLWTYRVHLFVFFITLFIGLTFAHPLILINDEWITANQLSQLNEGHQVIINEGKYGSYENGTPSAYFTSRSNILGYSLFLPLVSLPTLWMVDLFGEHFVFLILYLWTFIAIFLLLLLHFFFREYTYIGRWRWTPACIMIAFVVFFINIFYYSSFPVTGNDTFPELMAIVFTNVIMLAIAATLIYEINRTIFENPGYSVFGTVVCLFSSSYFFWATGCKDHILVLPIFTAVFLCLVKFLKTDKYWYLSCAFFLSGLLAWARPELALWIFFLVGGMWVFTFTRHRAQENPEYGYLQIFCSPFLTVVGAIPFFLNNYMITKNFLLPPITMYSSAGESAELVANSTKHFVQQTVSPSVFSLIHVIAPTSAITPLDFIFDLMGIFFWPQNGSVSVFSLVPLFLVSAIVIILLFSCKKIRFAEQEKKFITLTALISLAIFLAYLYDIHGLNTSHGIIPDIRYLSPIYIPLSVFGLILIKKVPFLTNNPISLLKKIFIVCLIGIPLSLFFTTFAYSDLIIASELIVPLNTFFIISIMVLILITVGVIIYSYYTQKSEKFARNLVPVLCSMPLFWQIDASYYMMLFGTAGGYTYWIPVVRAVSSFLFNLPFNP